ncbi:hypothetical protein Cob_v007264 [Colletotrichum orbiculare MAFF 240422]|uniref:Uncharacterized protein n=1 Tax=Colletotrichum orbiculare (strain 104-T / ATCC 96160 / CBS 514.97 / LARS 414 / MAFF 240422) TaxID=1213857 RepID=A0A484FQE1_COLOR|nr:hypothetical protein Cob_v007264 [Colletotrichum orbiculare MAFF 240422]
MSITICQVTLVGIDMSSFPSHLPAFMPIARAENVRLWPSAFAPKPCPPLNNMPAHGFLGVDPSRLWQHDAMSRAEMSIVPVLRRAWLGPEKEPTVRKALITASYSSWVRNCALVCMTRDDETLDSGGCSRARNPGAG